MYRAEAGANLFSDGETARLVKRARTVHQAVVDASIVGDQLGRPQSVVTQFERLFTIQIPVDTDSGVLLGFSRDVGRNLSTFVDECRSVLARSRSNARPSVS